MSLGEARLAHAQIAVVRQGLGKRIDSALGGHCRKLA